MEALPVYLPYFPGKKKLAEGIVEKAPVTTTSNVFYIPHKPAVKNPAKRLNFELYLMH